MPLSAAQICKIARQNAKVRGFETQSGQFLNVALRALNQNYDFDLARGAFNTTLTGATTQIGNLNAQLASGPFKLPLDYLRCKEGDVYYYPIGLGNQPFPLIPVDINEFDGFFQTAGFMNYPVYFVTDLGVVNPNTNPPTPANFYVWPPAGGAYPLFLRYYRQMPEIGDDVNPPELSTDIPWFPNEDYLIREVQAHLEEMTGDPAAAGHFAMNRKVLDRYLKMKDDKSDRSQSVKLDRRRFGKQYSTLPRSKFFGGW